MLNYPPAPAAVNPEVTQPSALYRAEVAKCILAVLFFILVYLLLLAASVALALFCIKLGLGIFGQMRGTLVLLAGGGIILIGLLILYFVLKFLFSSNKVDRSSLVQITEQDQPQLFDFIRRITTETQAPFPKKIYLSNEVNASVFYDSTFWSMFLPVRKNLLIGLGLVNSVTLSEFKAILAHEFGHFSQKSMKVGSWIYNANRIIHNLLYDNEGFFRTLNRIAGIHIILTLCMHAVAGIVKGIQHILMAVYKLINKQNMKLSREMEFHADSVAASVAGSNPLTNALYRLELAETSFNATLNTCTRLIEEHKQEQNIYPVHSEIMTSIGKEHQLPVAHQLPQLDRNTFAGFDLARINIENQWASHPSTPDREDALNQLNIQAEEVHTSAWTVFTSKEKIQSELTTLLYQQANLATDQNQIGQYASNFYQQQQNLYALPDYTLGYWDYKVLPDVLPNPNEASTFEKLSELYSEDIKQLNKKMQGIESDCNTLQAIINKEIEVSGFEFEGVKCVKASAPDILERLQKEKEQLQNQLQEQDARLMNAHARQAELQNQLEQFIQVYEQGRQWRTRQNKFTELHTEILNTLGPIFRGELTEIQEVRSTLSRATDLEGQAVQKARNLMQELETQRHNFAHHFVRLNTFVEQARMYLQGNEFIQSDFNSLIDGLNHVAEFYGDVIFRNKKQVLEFSAST